MQSGNFPLTRTPQATPKHSAAVTAVDKWGNMVVICHTINAVFWGWTGIFVDGVSIPDSASFQQAAVLKAGPGNRLPDPTNPLIVLRDGKPVIGSSSIGAGLHPKTISSLVNVLDFGMNPGEANAAPELLNPASDGRMKFLKGQIRPEVLKALKAKGLDYVEVSDFMDILSAKGWWVGAAIDPKTGARQGTGSVPETAIAY